MAYDASTTVSIGAYTKAGDHNKLGTNIAWVVTKADVEHDFNVVTGTGAHNAVNTSLANLANVVEVGALNAGSILSGFGNVDIGASTLDAGATTVTALTASDVVSVEGTYDKPFLLGTVRIWYDPINAVVRWKDSAPSSALDGTRLWDDPIRTHPATVSEDHTIPANYNALSVGPLTIADGTIITAEPDATWVII